jgi:large subunit ribosomal protein L28
MSARCQVAGRMVGFGNTVSHSHRRTRRRWSPSIQVKTYYLPSEDRRVTLRISAKGIKAIGRHGIEALVATLRRTSKNSGSDWPPTRSHPGVPRPCGGKSEMNLADSPYSGSMTVSFESDLGATIPATRVRSDCLTFVAAVSSALSFLVQDGFAAW